MYPDEVTASWFGPFVIDYWGKMKFQLRNIICHGIGQGMAKLRRL